MLFDTDVLIFVQRGHEKAAQLIEDTAEHFISVQSYMELLQDAQNKQQHRLILSFLRDFGFEVLPLNENIGKRAAIYVEEYSLSHHVRAGDAIIAATAVENGLTLMTANTKHFKPIKELSLSTFNPSNQ
jgi:predicted nucleic acid-binding protein